MHPTLAEHSITAELDEIVAGLRIAGSAADDGAAEQIEHGEQTDSPARAARPEPAVRTRYTPKHPLDLSSTLNSLARGGDGPCFQRTPRGAWLTLRTPAGPVTLLIEREAHGVEAAAWGAGAEWVIERVPSLLGADDDWSDLDLSSSPLLTEVRRRNPGLRLARTGTVFELLVPSVLEQKVTCVEAWRSWRMLVRRHGEVAPGPAQQGLVVAPSAEQWRSIPSWEWHEAGVGPQRSQTVVRTSRVADAIERTIDVSPAEAATRLTSLPGIGTWTAAEVTSRSHGDPDAVSVGDFHLASTVGMALTGSPVDDDAMLELLHPWAGQRQRVIRLIWLSGVRKPRRGPRITIQDHRRR